MSHTVTRLTLPVSLDRSAIETLRDSYAAAVAAGPVAIEGREVARVGALGLQFLLSVAHTAAQAGHAVRLHRPSPALSDAVRLLGLDPHFTPWTELAP